MNAADVKVRRATIDDLGQLGPLLHATLLPAAELEKRFTEFQVVEATDGRLVGALGMQIAQKHGKIHSETYSDFSQSDLLRPLLWDRLQNVAQNYGLTRLWTQETAPFWKQAGFAAADDPAAQKLPMIFGQPKQPWLTLKLKEDVETVISLDKELAVFIEAEKARTEEVMSQAKVLRGFAYLLAFGLLVFVLAGAFLLFKKKQSLGVP